MSSELVSIVHFCPITCVVIVYLIAFILDYPMCMKLFITDMEILKYC